MMEIFGSYLTVTWGLDVFAWDLLVLYKASVRCISKGVVCYTVCAKEKCLIYWNLRFFCLWPCCFVILDLKKFFSGRWTVVMCSASWFAFVVWFDFFGLGWFFLYLPWVLRRAIFAILKCFYKENFIYFNRSFNKIRLNHLYYENIDDFLKLVQLIIRSWKKKSTWKVELKFYFNQRKSMVRAWFTSLQSVLLVSAFCPWNVIMKAKWLARKKKKKK